MAESTTQEALKEAARRHLDGSLDVKARFREACIDDIVRIGEACAAALEAGGKLLICGNGGSAADAQHMSAELVVRLTSSFERRALPAMALTTDTSLLTACGNDYGFEDIFARQVEAFGRPEDLLIGISTSGNSGNVAAAFAVAGRLGVKRALLSGQTGGKLRDQAELTMLVPSPVTAHIQECHIAAIHIICDIIERRVCGKA